MTCITYIHSCIVKIDSVAIVSVRPDRELKNDEKICYSLNGITGITFALYSKSRGFDSL